MRFDKLMGVMLLTLGTFCCQTALGVTVNADIEGAASDETYVGDNGVLSSAGGSVWNSILHLVDAADLLDEFGASSGIGVAWLASDFGPVSDGAATNVLQDSGTFGEGFEIIGLEANSIYTLAIYAIEGSFGTVTDASGPNAGFWNIGLGGPTFVLPGIEGRDYALFSDLVPFDVGGGVFGIRIDGLDGAVTGFQVTSPVPLPAAVWLFGAALGLLGWRGRRAAQPAP